MQGAAEDHVQDGHLDAAQLPRRAGVRGRGPEPRRGGQLLRGHGLAHRRHRAGRDRRARPTRATRRRSDAGAGGAGMLPSGGQYRFRAGRRAAPVDAGDDQPAAAGDAHERPRRCTGEYAALINDQTEQQSTLRGLFRFKPAHAGAARGGGAGRGDREALRHRRHVLRLDQPRGARDAGHRHEPARRHEQQRRGRRGPGALRAAAQRRQPVQRDQAGGQRPLRRDRRVPGQRARAADQDRPGRQARRGRPAARPQGERGDRPGAALDAGRDADLAAAAPRHLLDRGHRAAHLRPEERQPRGAGVGEAGLGGRAWARWPPAWPRARADMILISGYDGGTGRLAAVLDQARRRAVGAGPGRDAADAGAERPAQPGPAADRRPDQDRPRRGDRARCWAPRSSASPRRRWSCAAA